MVLSSKKFTKKYIIRLENMVNMYYTENDVKNKTDLFAVLRLFLPCAEDEKTQNR